MTKDEIKAALDAAGVEYDARWNTAKLAALLMDDDGPVEKPDPDTSPTVDVVVMHPTGIQLDSTKEATAAARKSPRNGYREFRWRGAIDRAEYEATCALDRAAGRELRLMAL